MEEKLLLSLLVDLHRDGRRQGPGSDDETRRALSVARIDPTAPLAVADIGCGTGASTLTLAAALSDAQITAVDLFPEFLELLAARAQSAGLSDRITTLVASMDALPFARESFDVIWSEGAIYNIGFTNGIQIWKPFLRPGGILSVSEITWLRPDPPQELRDHWNREYPEIATAPEKIHALEEAGYDLLGYLVLPPSNWIENYYEPTAERIPAFLKRHAGTPAAAQVAQMEREEADLYQRYQDWFSYGFYIARKR